MQRGKEKIAFFDFCETLVNFQTADAYVHFTRQKYHIMSMRIRYAIYKILHRIKVIQVLTNKRPKSSINKRFILWQLKGLKREMLQNSAIAFCKEQIYPNLIAGMMDEMIRCQKEGYRIVLISGGYGIYLREFAKKYNIAEKDVIASEIEFRDDICTGKIVGEDCLWEEKTKRLEGAFNKENIYSIAYSDSRSDLYLLKWVDQGYVVSRNMSQKWCKGNKLNEIIWNEKNM